MSNPIVALTIATCCVFCAAHERTLADHQFTYASRALHFALCRRWLWAAGAMLGCAAMVWR